LPGASPDSDPGASAPRTQPGTTGVASALARDPAEPAAPPDLRGGLPPRLSAHGPPLSAAGTSRYRPTRPRCRGLPRPDPRQAAGLHQLGALPGQPAAPGGQPGASRGAGRPA